VSTVTVEQVVRLAEQLSPSDRVLLIHRLQAITPDSERVTREMIVAEHARRVAAGAFKNVESLYGHYARPGLDLSFEDIEAAIDEYSWEDELDELFDED
jgi:hypothetical protein